MNGIEHFSESRNLARVKAGLKGGPFLSDPNTPPSMRFVEGYPSSVDQNLQHKAPKEGTPVDTWKMRHSKSL